MNYITKDSIYELDIGKKKKTIGKGKGWCLEKYKFTSEFSPLTNELLSGGERGVIIETHTHLAF